MTDYRDEHEAFAASRSSDYVYEPGNDTLYAALDNHAETIEGDTKLPLTILGAPGCGKSALLANWVKRRRVTKHRDEFLFQHFVGCSPRSKQLGHLLFRLESALKDHFQLREMEVPSSEERLRWSLNRFLAAAAKKQFPARIVIVIDAVNRLLGEASAADTLHWLPTELPPCVRFIVSTLELEKYGSNPDEVNENARIHRTYMELKRRKCPIVRLDPLNFDTRHAIIGVFMKQHEDALAIDQAQQYKIVTAKPSSQPMFLRTILHALVLGVEMSEVSIDEQIDTYLAAETSANLISRIFDLCATYVEKGSSAAATSGVRAGARANPNAILGRVLSALYASRHGLSDDEIWGIVELATGTELLDEHREAIRRILKDQTMTVDGLRSFSHEDYASVVYTKYIEEPSANVKTHQLMARYFGKFTPCDRKLDALPYHLEVSGSWSKLKAALVDVEMFMLWWTPKHKHEFINLWASLTACENIGQPILKLVTGDFDEKKMRCAQPSRPCLDLIEEYVRAVDEYKFVKNPSDEHLANVILKVADFLLEFATLALEEPADVPQFIHPALPNDDLKSLGVPFITADDDGNSVLCTPLAEGASNLSVKPGAVMVDAPLKVNEEIPTCSTYFYHRWMWIQFPWVALANCGKKYLEGVAVRQQADALRPSSTVGKPGKGGKGGPAGPTKAALALQAAGAGDLTHDSLSATEKSMFSGGGGSKGAKSPHGAAGTGAGGMAMSQSLEKLPEITRAPGGTGTTRKRPVRTQHVARVPVGSKGAAAESAAGDLHNQIEQKTVTLRQQVDDYRRELDMLRQERVTAERNLQVATDEMNELSKMHFATSDLEETRDNMIEQIHKIAKNHKLARLLYKNYQCVHQMCERHPAHNLALIDELENKLMQDQLFIDEVRQKLREHAFESQSYAVNNKVMQRAVREMAVLQNDMMMQRIHQREHLKKAAQREAAMATQRETDLQRAADTRLRKKNTALHKTEATQDDPDQDLIPLWEKQCGMIHSRTGFADPIDFFAKFANSHSLESQMDVMKNHAEGKLKELKDLAIKVEQEMEHARYEAQSLVGSNSKDKRDKEVQLAEAVARNKHAREGAVTAEKLLQSSSSGLKHVCSILGIPPPDHDTPVNEIIHQIESVLEALMEEKDKTVQKIGDQPSFRENSPGYEKLMRPPELDAALQHHEKPKALVANRLPNKPVDESKMGVPEYDDDDHAGGGKLEDAVASRDDVKREAQKSLKLEQRRLARATQLKDGAMK